MTRTFQIPENHIIYDAGAGSIRATLVTFSTSPSADTSSSATKSKGNTTTIEVKAIGYAREAGGNELDRRLRELLIEDFEAKHHKDIRGDARGLTKLWKEAGRIKAVLSANADASSTVSKDSRPYAAYFNISVSYLRSKALHSTLTIDQKSQEPVLKNRLRILNRSLLSQYWML